MEFKNGILEAYNFGDGRVVFHDSVPTLRFQYRLHSLSRPSVGSKQPVNRIYSSTELHPIFAGSKIGKNGKGNAKKTICIVDV